jgi:hypothetical protein
MTNPRVHILADQDQLTGHSQGRYTTDKDNLIVHHCLMIIEYLDTIFKDFFKEKSLLIFYSVRSLFRKISNLIKAVVI